MERRMGESKEGRPTAAIAAAAAILLSAYVVTLAVIPRHVFWTPDSGVKWMQLQSLRWDDWLPRSAPALPTTNVDPDGAFLPDAKIYPHPRPDDSRPGFRSPSLFPLLSRAAVAAFGANGIYLLPLLGGWLTAVVAGLLLRRRCGSTVAAATILVTGLATPIWFYSVHFWEHTLATCAALLAAAFVGDRGRVGGALALVVALAALRLEMLAFALALVAAHLAVGPVRASRQGDAAPATIGAKRIVFIGACWSVAAALAGWSLSERHWRLLWQLPAEAFGHVVAALGSPRSIVDVFVHTGVDEALVVGNEAIVLASVGWAAAVLLAVLRGRRVEHVALAVAFVLAGGFSLFLLLAPPFYRSLHGLLPVVPIAVLAPFGIASAWRGSDRVLRLLAALVVAYVPLGYVAISLTYIRAGRLEVGLEWGQRYLLALYPLLAVMAVYGVWTYAVSGRPLRWRRGVVGAFLVLAQVGVALEVRGLAMVQRSNARLAAWEEQLRAEPLVATPHWWMPASLAQFTVDRGILYTPDRASLQALLEQLPRYGVQALTYASIPAPPADAVDGAGWRVASRDVVRGLRITRLVAER